MGDDQPSKSAPPPAPASRTTLAAIAEAVGVSSKTVSLALRGDASVSAVTSRRIREAAAQLGYERRRDRTGIFGVITPRISHPFYSELLDAAQEYADAAGFATTFRRTNGRVTDELAAIQELDRARTDGIVLVSPSASQERLHPHIRASRPIVAINSGFVPEAGLACVSADAEEGARQAVSFLLERGHRKIAYLSGPGGSLTRRRQIYEEAPHAHGCRDYRFIVEAGRTPPATHVDGYDACCSLLEPGRGRETPTAILAFNDVMALGAMRALHERGFRVPDDIWLIGFDDLEFARFMIPTLTTVAVPRRQLASEAISILVQLLEARSPKADPPLIALTTRLTLRESTP